MPSIKYSQHWDKLSKQEFTTIRTRYSEAGLDKMDYYKPGEIYEQVICGKPEFKARLMLLENMRGKDVLDWILEEDVMFQGKPDKEWYNRVRSYEQCIILHFRRVD